MRMAAELQKRSRYAACADVRAVGRHYVAMGRLRIVLTTIRVALAYLVRGVLLWVTVPLSLAAYLLCLPVLLLRAGGLGKPYVRPRYWIDYGTQILDAGLYRVFRLQEVEEVPWPWQGDSGPEQRLSPLDFY
jgi:hypothetical protein